MLLPSPPSSICPTCWNGPLKERLGISRQPIEKSRDDFTLAFSYMGGAAYEILSGQLLSGASSSCKFCLFIVERCPKDALLWPFQTINIRVGNTRQGDFVVVVNEVEVENGIVYTDFVHSVASYAPPGPPLPDVGFQRTLALAKASLEQCVHGHDGCQQRAAQHSKATAPRRLIDCTNPLRPRIIAAKGTHRIYVALSYVSGGEDQPYRLSKANISSYIRRGIDPETLPQTIRDAIHVTHTLGITYLWVDGLCIIQDSQKDKRRELASMRDIYRHAYLTIDAASARKVTDGFLQNRPLYDDPELALPFPNLRGSGEQAEIGTLYISCSIKRPHRGSGAGTTTGHGSQEGTLRRLRNDKVSAVSNLTDRRRGYTGRRAWCLQETLLSTRCLVFSDLTVHLRCQTTSQNVGGAPHTHSLDVPRLPDAVFLRQPRIKRYSDEWTEIRQIWSKIVREYSRRSLSCPSDKLVACAALAETFAFALGSCYVAGLWDDGFIFHDLLWQVTSWSPRPVAYRAPSWSWASVDGEVSMLIDYLDPSLEALAEVIDCRVTAQSKKFPFGPVSDGSLILRGRLYACASGQNSPFTTLHLQLGSNRGMYNLTNQAATVTSRAHPFNHRTNLFVDIRIVQVDPFYDFEDAAHSKELWAVPIQRHILDDGSFERCEGLLIAPDTAPDVRGDAKSKRKRRGVFQRVGHFRTYNPENAWKLGWDLRWSLVTATEFELV